MCPNSYSTGDLPEYLRYEIWVATSENVLTFPLKLCAGTLTPQISSAGPDLRVPGARAVRKAELPRGTARTAPGGEKHFTRWFMASYFSPRRI